MTSTPVALLEGADVAAFAADDPALHVVAGDIDGADGGVGGVLGGVALDGGGQDLAGLLLADGSQMFLVLLDAGGDLVGQLLVEPFQQQLFGLLAVEAADLVQFLGLLLEQRFQLLAALFELLAAFVQLALAVLQDALFLQLGLVLLLEAVLAFLQAAFLLAQLVPGLVPVPRLNSSRFLNSSSLAFSSDSLTRLSASFFAWAIISATLAWALLRRKWS